MHRISLLLSVSLLLSCGEKTPPEVAAAPEPAEAPLSPVAAEVLSAMDLTADPCVDFYQYACGGWMASTPLPADKPAWGRSFSSINERNREFLKELLDRAAADPTSGDADWQRMGNIYGACLDEAALEEQGIEPLKPWLDEIAATKDPKALAKTLGDLERVGVSLLAGVWVDGDNIDPQLAILHLSQTGLGLPDRDYYLKDDAESVQLLAEYQAWMSTVLGLLGTEKDPAAMAAKVLAFEKSLAEVHWDNEVLRDPEATYHKIDRKGLVALNKDFPWGVWLETVEAGEVNDINVSTPEPMQAQAKIFVTALKKNPDVLKAWLRTRLVAGTQAHLPAAYYDAGFEFFNKKVYGQQQPEPRWKRCVDTANGTVGEIVGKFYVEEMFPGDSKEKAEALIVGIQDAFEAGLPELEWMDDETRAAAVEKKNLLKNKIGYPDTWRDYSALETAPDAHLQNMLNNRQVEHSFWLAQAGKEVDAAIWFMAASQVNAYYHPIRAEMVFPAGILQPPFFSRDFPMAMNFGGIGMVMGHELTHGFDDSGRKFDGTGRMVEWWPAEVATAFDERAQCVDDFYSGYSVGEGLPVNGKLTLGENIADIGGTKEAFNAYRKWVEQNGPEAQIVPQLNNEQLFFVAMAQGWCSVASPEYEKMQVMSNPHSPARFRVLGPASNLAEFAETFQCEAGQPMRPDNACVVW